MDDALTSLAEAIVLAMSRTLDIDVREINAGHRFAILGDKVYGDIFFYDTLAGGAGYATQAADSFCDIFDTAINILTNCSCNSSCVQCLRHYGNRFHHASLNRHLALNIAKYIKEGALPPDLSLEQVSQAVAPLKRTMMLAGWKMVMDGEILVGTIPGRRVRIGLCPSLLLQPKNAAKPCDYYFTPYELSTDLSSAYSEVA
jgi:ATP-dependent helicase YprA (DUF1998 family)